MTNVDLDKTPFVATKPNKIFGTADTPVDFTEAFRVEKTVGASEHGPLPWRS